MIDRKVGGEPGNEDEPIPRLRIGDIVTLFSRPDERFLVSEGDVENTGYFSAVKLLNDTRVERFPGTKEVSDVSGVIGRMDSGEAVELMIAASVPDGDPNTTALLRGIMAERLEKEQSGE